MEPDQLGLLRTRPFPMYSPGCPQVDSAESSACDPLYANESTSDPFPWNLGQDSIDFSSYPEPPILGTPSMPYVYPRVSPRDIEPDFSFLTTQFKQHDFPLPGENVVEFGDIGCSGEEQDVNFDDYIDPALFNNPNDQKTQQHSGIPEEVLSKFHEELVASRKEQNQQNFGLPQQLLVSQFHPAFDYNSLGPNAHLIFGPSKAPLAAESNDGLEPSLSVKSQDVLGGQNPVLPRGRNVGKRNVDEHRIGIFPDEDSYLRAVGQRITIERDRLIRAKCDSGCPTNPSQKRVYINRLFDAMKNTSNVIDKTGKNGAEAVSVRKMREGAWPDQAIEMACWEIFVSPSTYNSSAWKLIRIKISCRDAQLGVSMVDAHHMGKREGVDVYPTFDARMNAIIEGCRISKAMCKSILDPSYIHRLVDAPKVELQLKRNNKIINGKRDGQNEIGRTAERLGIRVADLQRLKSETSPEKSEDGEEVASQSPPTYQVQDAPIRTRKRRSAQVSGEQPMKQSKRGRKRKNFDMNNGRCTDNDYDDDDEYIPEASNVMDGYGSAGAMTRSKRTYTGNIISGQSSQLDDHQYKETICRILGVSKRHAQNLSLEELRTYARAYNEDLRFDDWFHPSLPNLIGRTFLFFTKNYHTNWHITALFPSLVQLALERGDILESGKQNFERSSVCLFSTKGNQLYNEALGTIDNPFGLFGYHLGDLGISDFTEL
ncbi:hypothetical protein F5884DRAFT_753552 [Xylogone sp. PMI_703]|nr:hypothetical protein F5884DRAFT_753552 [Xylogone sp. PMI_703]